MNPILQFVLKPLVFAGGIFISMKVTLTRQLCIEGGWPNFESELNQIKGMSGFNPKRTLNNNKI